jgi:hypothetical protein
VTIPAGEVRWLDAQVHSGENIGESAAHVSFVELKEGATASGAEPRLGPA